MNARLRPTVGSLLNDARFSFAPSGGEDVVRQVLIMFACYAAYDVSRALAQGREAVALANGVFFMNLEKALGIWWEPWIQGRVAGERCRLVVVTDEDPRGEDRDAILAQIAAGAEAAGRRRGEDLLLIADREAAIREAFARARPGDVVLLAGKGHETGILYADHELPWDERAVAERLLAELGR